MREIKFRAWFDGHMYEVAKLDFWGEPDQASCDLAGPGENGEGEELFDIYVGEVEIMQYTGLKDRNGKEIYEGDIIGIDVYYVDDFGETYKERNYAEVFREQSGYWDCDFKDDLDGEFLIDYVTEEEGIDYPWKITVEGNIYENPELMALTND